MAEGRSRAAAHGPAPLAGPRTRGQARAGRAWWNVVGVPRGAASIVRASEAPRARSAASVALVLVACGSSPPPAALVAPAAAPLTECERAFVEVEDAGAEREVLAERCDGEPAALDAACEAGDVGACFEAAVQSAHELAGRPRPDFYESPWQRACELGHVDGCVAHAARRISTARQAHESVEAPYGGMWSLPEEEDRALRAPLAARLGELDAEADEARVELARLCGEDVARACHLLGTTEHLARACELGRVASCYWLAARLDDDLGAPGVLERVLALELLVCTEGDASLRGFACEHHRAHHAASLDLPFDPAEIARATGGEGSEDELRALWRSRASIQCGSRDPRAREACEEARGQLLAHGDADAAVALAGTCAERGCAIACGVAGRDRMLATFEALCESGRAITACSAIGWIHADGCGGPPDPECAFQHHRRACQRLDCGLYDVADPSPPCVAYAALRRERSSAENAPGAACDLPLSACILLSEATTVAETTAALQRIRSADEAWWAADMALPILERVWLSGDGRRFALQVSGEEDEPIFVVADARGARSWHRLTRLTPGSDAEVEAWLRDEVMRFWEPLAAELTAGGFRPLETISHDAGAPLRVVIDAAARQVRVVEGERERWSHRIRPSSRACRDTGIAARLAWDPETLRVIGRVHEIDWEECDRVDWIVDRLAP